MRMAIRGRPRDKRWKHVLRINYGRNQWTARVPRRNSAQTGSFLLKMRECAHGEFVLQPFRNREEERDAGKKITILRILRSMETKRTKKNETCHRVNRFRRKKNDTETQLVYSDTRGTCNWHRENNMINIDQTNKWNVSIYFILYRETFLKIDPELN